MKTPPIALLEMDPENAQAVRFHEGRRQYGPRWQGDHPLLEAYVELLDCGVYIAEAERWSDLDGRQADALRVSLLILREQLIGVIRGLRASEPHRLEARAARSADADDEVARG